jgi:hypothetical protein
MQPSCLSIVMCFRIKLGNSIMCLDECCYRCSKSCGYRRLRDLSTITFVLGLDSVLCLNTLHTSMEESWLVLARMRVMDHENTLYFKLLWKDSVPYFETPWPHQLVGWVYCWLIQNLGTESNGIAAWRPCPWPRLQFHIALPRGIDRSILYCFSIAIRKLYRRTQLLYDSESVVSPQPAPREDKTRQESRPKSLEVLGSRRLRSLQSSRNEGANI